MQPTDQQKKLIRRLILACMFGLVAYLYGQSMRVSSAAVPQAAPRIIVAPSVYATLDETKYQPAYNSCMAGASASVMLCEVNANQAVTGDAQQRFADALAQMYYELGPRASRIFAQKGLVFMN
jgi:hypothetical protein